MAIKETTVTGASGETEFLSVPSGRGWVGATGTISAGALLLLVKPPGAATEYVADTINATVIQQNADEAGTGYGFFEEISVPRFSSVALAADASFAGSLTVCVVSDEAI